MRIFPEMWASTLWPFSSSTRNMAFGNGSVTVPSRTIASSLGLGSELLPTTDEDWPDRPRARERAGASEAKGYSSGLRARLQLRSPGGTGPLEPSPGDGQDL